MKKLLVFGFLFTFLMTAFTVDLDAQYTRKRKKKKKKTTTEKNSEYFDESGQAIGDRLWYGADALINFGSFFGQSDFIWGIGPMVGYKFTDNLSVGPRLSVLNTISKRNISGIERSINLLDFGGGIFARHKILGTYFLHAEFELLDEEFLLGDAGGNILVIDNEVQTIRETNPHYYFGGGYGAGNGTLGFSAYILWDFAQEFSSSNIPIVTRFGVTYKF